MECLPISEVPKNIMVTNLRNKNMSLWCKQPCGHANNKQYNI